MSKQRAGVATPALSIEDSTEAELFKSFISSSWRRR
jgi:hypothetical protein